MHSPYATTIRDLGTPTDANYLTLVEALRISLELESMSEAPRSGICFTAYLSNGKRVTCERFDEAFVCGTTGAPRRPIPASEFVGWLTGSEDAAPDPSSPRIETADDEYAWASALGREED